jgi:hypothetical protein
MYAKIWLTDGTVLNTRKQKLMKSFCSILQHSSVLPLDMDCNLEFITLILSFNKNGQFNGMNVIQNVSTLTT